MSFIPLTEKKLKFDFRSDPEPDPYSRRRIPHQNKADPKHCFLYP